MIVESPARNPLQALMRRAFGQRRLGISTLISFTGALTALSKAVGSDITRIYIN